MPKFSDSEKELIHERLLEKGRELFGTYGLKKTSIDDIVQACGIAKGSFYKFFPSKEVLYFRILEREESFRDQLIAELLASQLPPNEALRQLLRNSFAQMEQSAFLQGFYEREEHELLFRKLPPEVIAAHIQQDNISSLSFIADWQREGRMIDARPEVIVGLLRGLVLLSLHKREIGTEIYDDVMEMFIDLVADGLTKGGTQA